MTYKVTMQNCIVFFLQNNPGHYFSCWFLDQNEQKYNNYNLRFKKSRIVLFLCQLVLWVIAAVGQITVVSILNFVRIGGTSLCPA